MDTFNKNQIKENQEFPEQNSEKKSFKYMENGKILDFQFMSEKRVKCPECKKEEGFNDLYYKNHEEYFYCQADKCGFSYTYLWARDNEGKLITRDGTKNYKFENLIKIKQ